MSKRPFHERISMGNQCPHRFQAASDARTFAEALRSAEEFHHAEVARLEAELAAQERTGHALKGAGERETADHRQQLLAQVWHG